MRLRSKIFLGYSAGMILLAAALGWGAAALLRLASATDSILRENYRSILAADNMIGSLERQDSGVLLILLGFMQEGDAELELGESSFTEWLTRAQDNITLPGESVILDRLESSYGAYLGSVSSLRRIRDTEPDAASGLYHERVLPLFRGVRGDAIRLRELNQEAMVTASARAESIGHRAILTTLVLGAILMAFGLLSSALLARRIARPLSVLSAAADRITEGDYDVDLPESRGDEIGHLAGRFAVMARSLQAFRDLNVGRLMAEKRRSEAIVRSIGDGLVVLDQHFCVVGMNPTAERIFGVDGAESTGKTLGSLLRDEGLLERVRMLATAERSRRPGANDLVLAVPEGEGTTYLELDITEILSDVGAPLGYVLMIEDITRFRELDRLKTEFVATASHQLKTPLTSMGLSLALLEERVGSSLDDPAKELLDVAREDSARMRELVDELLDLSRIESDQLVLDLAAVAMPPLVSRILAAFEAQAREAGVTLSTEIQNDLPVVCADGTKVGWVLTNLISNALRHTSRGGHVLVSADAVREFVQISVSDDGGGIPFELQARIFDKFVQVPGERAVGGSGLGLAIAKAIVQAHGGNIWVDSTPGGGSTFSFLLPCVSQAPHPSPSPSDHNE